MNLKLRLERLETKAIPATMEIDCVVLVGMNDDGVEDEVKSISLQDGSVIQRLDDESETEFIDRAKSKAKELTSSPCVLLTAISS